MMHPHGKNRPTGSAVPFPEICHDIQSRCTQQPQLHNGRVRRNHRCNTVDARGPSGPAGECPAVASQELSGRRPSSNSGPPQEGGIVETYSGRNLRGLRLNPNRCGFASPCASLSADGCRFLQAACSVQLGSADIIFRWSAFWSMATITSSSAVPCRSGRRRSTSLDTGP
jgi:hypothetical protein